MTDPALEAVRRRNEERLAAGREGFIGGALIDFDTALLIDRLDKAEATIARAKVATSVIEEYAATNRSNAGTTVGNEDRRQKYLNRANAFETAANNLREALS